MDLMNEKYIKPHGSIFYVRNIRIPPPPLFPALQTSPIFATVLGSFGRVNKKIWFVQEYYV